MAVKIRLSRRGKKRKPIYCIVVADARAPRDGRFIEKLGTFDTNYHPSKIVLNDERAFNWLMNGAQPTETTKHILSRRGIMLRKHLQMGVRKGALTEEVAKARFKVWAEKYAAPDVLTRQGIAPKLVPATETPKPDEATTAEALATETPKPDEAATAEALATETPKPDEAATAEALATETPKPDEAATAEALATETPKPV